MWNQTQSSGPNVAYTGAVERATRTHTLTELMETVAKNAAMILDLSGQVAERVVGPEPRMESREGQTDGGGLLGEMTSRLRQVDQMQRDALAQLQRLRAEI